MQADLYSPEWQTEYHWLCQRRQHFPAQADIWHLRFHWQAEQAQINTALRNQTYRFEPLERITKANGDTLHLRSSRDALVVKRLANLLPARMGLSKRCTHLKHHGGLKATVCRVKRNLARYRYVIRTDILGYYEHINQMVLLQQLEGVVKDRFVMNLLVQCIRRTVHWGGLYRDVHQGIARGCPLSPLLGAFYLKSVDEAFTERGLFYVRYMDDLLIMTNTRWQLRRALKRLYALLEPLKLRLQPDKTFIGRIEKGFDFLGYRFSHQPLGLAAVTVERFRLRCHRLYEQQQTAPDTSAVLGDYVIRWRRWAAAGLGELQPLHLSLPEPESGQAQGEHEDSGRGGNV